MRYGREEELNQETLNSNSKVDINDLMKKVLIKFGQKYFKIFLNSILTIISIYLILNGFLNYDFTFSS